MKAIRYVYLNAGACRPVLTVLMKYDRRPHARRSIAIPSSRHSLHALTGASRNGGNGGNGYPIACIQTYILTLQ